MKSKMDPTIKADIRSVLRGSSNQALYGTCDWNKEETHCSGVFANEKASSRWAAERKRRPENWTIFAKMRERSSTFVVRKLRKQSTLFDNF